MVLYIDVLDQGILIKLGLGDKPGPFLQKTLLQEGSALAANFNVFQILQSRSPRHSLFLN
jgi:hypothetical protein